MRRHFNWKTGLLMFAIVFVATTLYYTNSLAKKLAMEESKRVGVLIDAIITSNNSICADETGFALGVITSNTSIPLIITNSNDEIISHKNIDLTLAQHPEKQLKTLKDEFKLMHPAIEVDYGLGKNYVYYGESYLLTQIRYFPYIQLTIMLLFVMVVIIALTTSQKSIQNQVWVGLSKETAHQLGTPLSSLEGWLTLLEEEQLPEEVLADMRKDLNRLKLVAERFAKIGNTPELVEENLIPRLQNMQNYMQKRAPNKVNILLGYDQKVVPVNLNGPLFDWVIENLMRNALDAMNGEGNITVNVTNQTREVIIDVEDTGKGIPTADWKNIFKPGYSTKKRGWGLGLSLAKRIIEKYHSGSIFVKHSEPGVGTKFRIILRR